jgi:hypothetical protein
VGTILTSAATGFKMGLPGAYEIPSICTSVGESNALNPKRILQADSPQQFRANLCPVFVFAETPRKKTRHNSHHITNLDIPTFFST